MSDLMLRTTIRSRVELQAAARRLVDYMNRAADRVQREQTGQDMVEYAGVLLVVSVIIALIAVTGVWQPLVTAIKGLVNDVTTGKSGASGG